MLPSTTQYVDIRATTEDTAKQLRSFTYPGFTDIIDNVLLARLFVEGSKSYVILIPGSG
jgi:hypothetical protein